MSSKQRRSPACFLAALLLVLASSCSRPPQREVERLAILPIENLSGIESEDPTAAAAAAFLHAQTTGLDRLYSFRPLSASDLHDARPTRVMRGYLTRTGGSLQLRAFLQDGASGKTLRIVKAAAPSGASAAVDLSAALSREIAGQPRPPGSRNPAAVQAYGQALVASSREQATALFRQAVAADPGFDDAWLALVYGLASSGQSAARDAATEALSKDLDAITKARLNLLLSGPDAARQQAALEQLARLQPADADVNRQAAAALVNRRQFPQALELFARASGSFPDSPLLWNEAAYAQAFAGRFDEALRSIERYSKLDSSPNPADSRGDIHYMAGRFSQAVEAYLESHQKDPRFLGGLALRKAAEARRMLGDLPDADALFQKYAEAGARNPSIGIQKAAWVYATGRKTEAAGAMEGIATGASTPPDIAAQAYGYSSVWKLMAGDYAAAREFARRALQAAKGEQARRLAALCFFVSSDPVPAADWIIRAEQAFPDPRSGLLKRYALAYALLFAGHFREAAPVLKEIYDRTSPAEDGHISTLRAWALTESGKLAEARTLLARYPHPQASGENAFECLTFPRLLALRAKLEGEPAAATALLALYRKYGGV